ncbi:hypothetical protein L1887_15407 [Cichorium endivia]|nr:hypothetical protein L1887_15407 [Cichorium endivia]
MPIFYQVDPSEVRKQNGKYGEAFAKHQLEHKSKVEYWRKALVDASNISGWEPKHIANGHESKGIKQIVVEISQKLSLVTSSVNENLIGMAARLQGLRSELQVGSGGVRMLGIWGVGGGGKTTLASSIYDEIYRQFDGCCFVENIREESGRYGLGKLKEKILSEIEVNKAGRGRLIHDRFRHRKVLIVLDDVDHLDQLKALAGSHDWFGDGSRIIITSRDEHILTAHKVNVIHHIRLLNDDEALTLFCKHAPRDNRRLEDYKQLSKGVVSYSGGLPLALSVLGSFLCDKDIDEWKSAIARLKDIPETDILQKLKISFDGLKPVEKELFLDIAYFFRWKYKDEVMEIIDCSGFHPVIGVKVLIQKALITITDKGKFDMHDLMQEMAFHIVRGEHPKRPEKHSRVCQEDIHKMCAMDATTNFDMIEAIYIEDHAYRLPEHLPAIVANTKNLRWILWMGDLSSPLLTNFPPMTLCCLILRFSPQIQLWEGNKWLPNLKTIELFNLDNLIMTPNFDGLTNLERFNVRGCPSLKEIHPSIVDLKKLVLLRFEGCDSLKMFPRILGPMKLQTLSFVCCEQLFNQHQNMDNSDDSGDIVTSHTEPSRNFFVTWLTFWRSNLPAVEYHLEDHSSPHNNMSNIGLGLFLSNLSMLDLSWCSLGDEEIDCGVWDLPNLIKLNLSYNKFSRLNFSRLRLPRLKWLDVSDNKKLEELSELPSSIAVVTARYCRSLESFGDISNCKWLWNVFLKGENKLGQLGGDILLDSMLQGNAIENHFISVALENHIIPKGFVGRLFWGRRIRLYLPDNWYNDFCGFSIGIVVTHMGIPHVDIVIDQEVDKDSVFELLQESNDAVKPRYEETTTHVGYISFDSLRHSLSNSSNTMITVSFEVEPRRSSDPFEYKAYYIAAQLVPRKSKGDQPQTTNVATDFSEFGDEKLDYNEPRTFKVIHDSKSSIKIKWLLY